MKKWKVASLMLLMTLIGCDESYERVKAMEAYCAANNLNIKRLIDSRSHLVMEVYCMDDTGAIYQIPTSVTKNIK